MGEEKGKKQTGGRLVDPVLELMVNSPNGVRRTSQGQRDSTACEADRSFRVASEAHKIAGGSLDSNTSPTPGGPLHFAIFRAAGADVVANIHNSRNLGTSAVRADLALALLIQTSGIHQHVGSVFTVA
ncbi:hypothetical protein BSZ35_05930 [Salinibacter sp. 10B]|nr:hypothetical protein BSZ35_05930 [Salinibacter sp. 10B]